MKNDLISIVVPIYNVEKYLPRCVDSIINQTYKNLEIILVDDGSTDKSGTICDEYRKIDNRIKVIHKDNAGLSDARNTGILKATGMYISFIDSDDYIHDRFISEMYNLLIENNAQIVSCNMRNFSRQPVKLKNDNFNFEICNSIEAIKYSLYERKIDNSVCNKIFDITLFDNVKFPKGKYFEDLATTYKLFLKANKIVYLNADLYFYYQNSTSIIHTYNEKKIKDLYNISVELASNLSNIPDLEEALNARIINIYFYICRESQNDFQKADCYKKIKKLRKRVLKDKCISFKTKMGIICSYLGIDFTNFVFNIYRKVLS